MLAELLDAGTRLVEQTHAGGGDFAQVVRRHVGGHAHGDAGGAVEQHVGQPRRQDRRLVQGAVEVRHPVHRALPQLGQQHLGIARQARLGVAHGGEGLGIVRRAPVALAVDQRVAVAERLGHQHHGLVAGAVAVRVELAEHVADGARGLLVLGVGVQAEFAHGIDDAPLYRLEAVADMRQRAIQDDVHGIVEVGLLGEVGERAPLHAVQAQVEGFAHGRSVTCWRSTRVPARWVNSSCFRALMPSRTCSLRKPGATMARTSRSTMSPRLRLFNTVR